MWRDVLLFISKKYLLAKDLLSGGIECTTKDKEILQKQKKKKGRKMMRSQDFNLGRILRFCKFFQPFHLSPRKTVGSRVSNTTVPFSFQPVSTDFAQYNSYGDVSGGIRGKGPTGALLPGCG